MRQWNCPAGRKPQGQPVPHTADRGEIRIVDLGRDRELLRHLHLVPDHRPEIHDLGDRPLEGVPRLAGIPSRLELERLGPNVWYDAPAAAMAVLEEIEETARLAWLARGAPRPLSETQIDELRRAFAARW